MTFTRQLDPDKEAYAPGKKIVVPKIQSGRMGFVLFLFLILLHYLLLYMYA